MRALIQFLKYFNISVGNASLFLNSDSLKKCLFCDYTQAKITFGRQ